MIKNLRFLFLSMLAVFVGTASADVVTFDFDNDYATLFPTLQGGVSDSNGSTAGDITETLTAQVGGVSLSVSAAAEGVKTPNRIWTGSPRLRMYSGTITVSAPGHKITAMTFTQGKWNNDNTADAGTLTSAGWEGDASSVTITFAGNTQFRKIEVELDGEGGGDEPGEEPGEEPQTEVVEATCAQVIAGADGTVYKVKGTVKNIVNTTYGNWDLVDETGSVYVYGTLDAQGNTKNFSSLGINEGDIVTVQGPKKTYNDKVELVDVTVLSIEHTGEQPTEPVVEGGTTPETAIGIEAAINAINTMADKQKTTDSYYVKGIVTEVSEISTANGNATFVMAEGFNMTTMLTIYRAKGLEKKDITDENYLKQGDEVVVYGQLQRYIDKDNNMIPEMAQGCYIYSINGRTKDEQQPDDYTFKGDGTKELPYTVEDLKHVVAEKEMAEGQVPVWVQGYIAGNLASAKAFNVDEKITASNIALAGTAEETEAANCVPVELKTKTSIREKVNLLDNPSNKGKEVLVCGYILQYFSVTGLKDVVDIIMDGQSTSGIGLTKADAQQQEAVYRLSGQRIGQAKKGVNVRKGRKFVVK